jgi:hypothetical protein
LREEGCPCLIKSTRQGSMWDTLTAAPGLEENLMEVLVIEVHTEVIECTPIILAGKLTTAK